ncbi:MAG TPA: D-glycero-beta-D-manno-heptose 1-phosphate adenylyltransferase [Pseudonocardiaceae bacterium]|nr:D-glycero-beta-D-manno-heptose 1-phosphate adenylyltransferase [Pseudonocardiaceae bacterium]
MNRSTLVVVGDTLLDADVEGTAERLCPDAPVPVLDATGQRQRPGGAGLAALLAARAGHSVVLVTALSADPPGRMLADLLAGHVEVVRMPLRGATVCKTRIRAGGQSLLRIDSGDGRAAAGPIGSRAHEALRRAGAVLVADYGRGVAANPTVRGALAELAGRVPVVWDPHPKGAVPVPGCRLVTPNEAEAVGFAAEEGVEENTAEDAVPATLRDIWGCAALAVTLGARGALLYTPQGCEVVPVRGTAAPPGQDTCGAGDAFAAAVAGALLHGACPREAVTTAVGAAARFVAGGGAAALDTPATVTGMVRPSAGCAALDIAARLRSAGRRLVATGGCFDLLHPGHLGLLRQARTLGDGLVVCLNSDESVRRGKGPGRPIVPAADRMAMLEALEPVDAVAVFDEDTPAALLELLRPDVWVKGGDYAVTDLPEADVVRRHGGEVAIIPMVEGYSTSRLVSAVRTAR